MSINARPVDDQYARARAMIRNALTDGINRNAASAVPEFLAWGFQYLQQ